MRISHWNYALNFALVSHWYRTGTAVILLQVSCARYSYPDQDADWDRMHTAACQGRTRAQATLLANLGSKQAQAEPKGQGLKGAVAMAGVEASNGPMNGEEPPAAAAAQEIAEAENKAAADEDQGSSSESSSGSSSSDEAAPVATHSSASHAWCALALWNLSLSSRQLGSQHSMTHQACMCISAWFISS